MRGGCGRCENLLLGYDDIGCLAIDDGTGWSELSFDMDGVRGIAREHLKSLS